MIGNVMNAGANSWEDVRVLLGIAAKPNEAIDQLQALVKVAKEEQAAAAVAQAKADGAMDAANVLSQTANEAVEKAAQRMANVQAAMADCATKQAELDAGFSALSVAQKQVKDQAADTAKREATVAAQALDIATAVEALAAKETAYQARIEKLRQAIGE